MIASIADSAPDLGAPITSADEAFEHHMATCEHCLADRACDAVHPLADSYNATLCPLCREPIAQHTAAQTATCREEYNS